jgi:zinc transport system ATP-binding protein
LQVIEVSGLDYSYGGPQLVLSGVHLSVAKGDFLALLGGNGSGKTTLLRILLGMLPASSGTVKLFGKDIKDFHEWDRIGYVAQQAFNIDKNFPATVRELVSTGLYSKRGLFSNLSAKDWEKVDGQIHQAGLDEYANTQIGMLSGGQQQRAFIARALVNSPDLLILDEPTSGIDEHSESDFYGTLEALNKQGVTIVLVSHDISLVSNKVKSIMCLENRTIFHGDSKSFRELVAKDPSFLFRKGMAVVHHHHDIK